MPKSVKAAPETPKARLASAIKTARNIMRKDAGLTGELDRIPQFAWLLFLKAFDDLEQRREVTERNYRPAIDAPFRWRDWAADPVNGMTGQDLTDFVNNELLSYLRDLRGTRDNDPRDILAAVFKETFNRMLSGYLLRDVVDLIHSINFNSSDDIHTMAHMYESMLREMRDAAGDSGEFYTPRPVIRFIVQQINPQLGDIVLDPAAGTGGFLAEALEHLRPQADTVQKRRGLHANLRGIEKKPIPYLLGMMNLLLHGVEQPNIRRDNALAIPLTQIGASAKVDVVLTNPPFGGEEEKSIQKNFPQATKTSETDRLFLQMIQRSLKPGGRCGMVLPNGLLFGTGTDTRIKQRLLEECDVHTIVRLPPGVFAPYTPIPTNLVFFEKTGRTRHVWFYEISPPEGKKNYSKTLPMTFEDFAECQAWWGGSTRRGRKETEGAWRVSIDEIVDDEYNLDRKNPNAPEDMAHLPPKKLIADLLTNEQEIQTLLTEIETAIAEGPK